MKFGKRLAIIAGACALAVALRADLQPWIQHLPAGPLIAVFFRSAPMPYGTVDLRRPPKETIPALTAKIAAVPSDAELYKLRASEGELALDFTAAEADWRKYASLAANRTAAYLELADYFHRRLQARDEVAALMIAGEKDASAFPRILAIAEEQDLPDAVTDAAYRAWIRQAPHDETPREKYIDALIENREYAAAQRQIEGYARAFPDDDIYPTEARANLALKRDSVDAAIRVYDRAFQPLWPADLAKAYFTLLDQKGRLREFTGRARTALEANPGDFDATARLFQYFVFQNNSAAARRVLVELRLARESRKQVWTAGELLTLAHLFERIDDVNEAARFYYALYSLPGAQPADSEKALAGITGLLFTHAGQMRFGGGDLSFYKDIATMDDSPGFFNGILSLILNSTWPKEAYAREDQAAVTYFERARAEQLVDLFDRRFPQSKERPALHASLIEAYAVYGDDAEILRYGRAFMASFPHAPHRVNIGLLMADAYARKDDERDEFAMYDQLLRELGAAAHGMPMQMNTPAPPQAPRRPFRAVFVIAPHVYSAGIPGFNPGITPDLQAQPSEPVNEYANILNRYLSRLAALKRPLDALRVYRREIDRNPNAPALYESFAAYLEQNGLGQDVESVYRKAIAKFADRSWYDRLARWYLRQKESSAFATITREVVGIFSGTELERYFNQVVATGSLDPVLYRQLNLYAHERFPDDLVFVRNLLASYDHPATYDPAASEQLLRQYWFYEPTLKNRLFERLSSSDKLYAELPALRRDNPGIANGNAAQVTATNPAAAQFSAEAEAWLSHFEAAAPAMRSLAEAYPGERPLTSRASAIYRSLAAYDPADTDISANLARLEYRADPRDRDTLAAIGDIYADRDRFDQARLVWNRMPRIEPGKSDGYLEAATVFWDYYLYRDALRMIRQARADFDDPTLFAYEAGAIYENEREFPRAIQQYVAGAEAGNNEAEGRLLRLAKRRAFADLVDRLTARTSTDAAATLRAAVLNEQDRKHDLEQFLTAQVNAARSATALEEVESLAAKYGIAAVQQVAMSRRVALTSDPVDKMRLRIELAKLYEQDKNIAAASAVIDALYRDNPLILGVVRAAVDFHVRNKQPDAAITDLLDAASHARPDLANSFTLEAANLATAADEYDRARKLLAGLLEHDPYHAEYLAAMAATYSKAGDDRGLRDYELAAIAALKKAPLAPADRTERIAALRRTLIPALARLGQENEAVDQYIEIIDVYPDDEALTREALLFAAAHNRTAQLLDSYKKTIAEAPRDYRWPIVLARLDEYAEDYPAAIAAYDRAMKERPDRSDIVQARAQLEERLMRFTDAVRTYTRLYELTYHDPQWMLKIAELHARLQQTDEAVAALKTAIIGAHSETPDADFEIAAKLESWNLIPQAADFAEKGAKSAGDDLAQDNGVHTWARVMTRARRIDPVLDFIWTAKAGPTVIPDVGPVITTYYTPEERLGGEKKIVARPALVEFANAAGMTGLEARWRFEAMSPPNAPVDPALVQLELERAEYIELARDLESYAAQHRTNYSSAALSQALEAYASEGDSTDELRLMRTLLSLNSLSGNELYRYLNLLAAEHPDDLIALIQTSRSEVKNQATQAAMNSGSQALAFRAVEARSAGLPPVWNKAYSALTGVYYADPAPAIAASFASALDTRTIGERVTSPFQRNQQLAGGVWFYYGARYGEYLDSMKRSNAGDYLPSTVESAPGNPDAWLQLGDYYADKNEVAKATTAYQNVLQLDSTRSDAEDHIARLLWKNGQHAEAVSHWRAAIALSFKEQSSPARLAETFWTHTVETIQDIGQAGALAELRPDIDRLLRDYINRNGDFRAEELLQAAWDATKDAGQDPEWLVRIAFDSSDADALLGWLFRQPELTAAQRVEIKRAQIASLRTSVQADEANAPYRREILANAQVELVSLLLDAGDIKTADTEWANIPERYRTANTQVQIRIAVANDALRQLLESWRELPSISVDALRSAATLLEKEGHKDASLTVLEFLYRHELRAGHLDAANFLGLAEVLLERSDLSGALAQLHRMAMVTPDSFETLLPAADLLVRYGRNNEAAEFVRDRIKAVPWDAAAKLKLVGLGPVPDRDAIVRDIAVNAQVAYATRVDAARLLAPQAPAALAGTELGLLSGGRVMPDSARHPYYVYARLAAAEDVSDASQRFALIHEALAIKPLDSAIRLKAVKAALQAARDSMALAIMRAVPNTVPDDASLAVKLADAAERLGDLETTQSYLQTAIRMSAEKNQAPLEARLKTIRDDENRRNQNSARQPVIHNVVDQANIVRPRIAGRAQ